MEMPTIKELEKSITEAKAKVAGAMRELRAYQALLKTVKRLQSYVEEKK